jgi:hypothetical protein
MLSEIELTTRQTETTSSTASTNSLSSTCSSLQFFPVRSKFYPIKKSMALAKKVGDFLDDIMDKKYFEHYMDDVLQTDFCEIDDGSSVSMVSFIFNLINLMNDDYVIEPILIDMLIYLERYLQAQKDWLHGLNMKRLVLCAASFALDMLEDTRFDNTSLLKLGGMSLRCLSDLELTFSEGIDWSAYIDEQTHQKACKALEAFQSKPCVADEEDELRGLAFLG